MTRIWFDMDGTIADFYGVDGWLESIKAGETRPYEVAKGLGNLAHIARPLNKVQALGYEIGIISWTAKSGTPAYLILLVRHRFGFPDIGAVIQEAALVGEEDHRQIGFSGLLLLLIHHGVKTTYGVTLQAGHGTAAVKNEYHFCQVAVHRIIPLSLCYICMITNQKGNSVNYRLTFQSLTAPVFSIGSPQSSSAALINGMLYTFRSI